MGVRGFWGSCQQLKRLAVLGKWQLREEAQETQRFGLWKRKMRGLRLKKVGQESVTKAARGSL